MFRENKQHLQKSFFDSQHLMSEKQKKMLAGSWAQIFRKKVFELIPEELFEVLYSQAYSRPNAAINILVAGDILKEGFDWSDEELENEVHFNLQVRYALGMNDIGETPPTLRTVYNFRRRVREHAEVTGENLYETVFNKLTDAQLDELAIKTGWQRMDSTQLLSNIARLNRLELVLTVLQQGVKRLAQADQERWLQLEEKYLSQEAQAICYRIKKEDSKTNLEKLGKLLLKLQLELELIEGEEEILELVTRTLAEQYKLVEEEPHLLPGEEIKAESLQSPHDPEATYRRKHGKEYKGYVANISETCEPDNEVQLITSVQTAPNTTDDGELLVAAVETMVERELEVEEITVDGGYNGEAVAKSAQEHRFVLRPTTIRAGKYNEDKLGWDRYEWGLDEDGRPTHIGCIGGQLIKLGPGQKKDWYTARFDRKTCEACPFFEKECRVRNKKKKPPTIHVQRKTIRTALQRQNMSKSNYAIRANVESTIHAVKRPFSGGKLSVRGLIRTHMVVCNSAVMVNLRRIHRYNLYILRKQEQKKMEQVECDEKEREKTSRFPNIAKKWEEISVSARNWVEFCKQTVRIHYSSLNYAI